MRPNDELQIVHAPSLKVFSKRMMPEVFETLIRIALELAHEGREGRIFMLTYRRDWEHAIAPPPRSPK